DWTGSVSVIDLSNGVTIPVSATHMPAYNELVFGLNNSTELSDANYAAILHGSQLQGATTGLSVVGNDGVAGDDSTFNFFFQESDFNHDRNTNSADLQTVLADLNHPGTFSGGDSNYDGNINSADLQDVLFFLNKSLPLLGTPGTPTLEDTGDSRFVIAWNAPSDPSVTAYDVYRDSTRIATDVTATTYMDSGLSAGTTHAYFVVGKDASNDSSWQSPELLASIPAAGSITLTPPALEAISAGQTATLSIPFTDSGPLTTHTGSINWGDGTTGTATVAESNNTGTLSGSHEFDSFGAYFGSISITDPGGSSATELFEIVVPTFYNTGPDGFVPGQTYALTPTFSDPDGDTPLSYYVSWGDGSTVQTYGGSTTDFTYAYSSASGSPFYCTVLVAAADGTFTDTPVIAEVPPTLSISGPSSITEGSAYALSDTVSGSSSGDTYDFSIDWGDGSTGEDVTASPGGAFSYTYDEAGTYTIEMIATDDTSGEGDIEETTITVAEATPTYSLALASTGIAGDATSLVDSFTDPAGHTLDSLSIDWGDGSSGAYYENPGTFSHDYVLPGTYAVTATFSDDEGTYTAGISVPVRDYGNAAINLSDATYPNWLEQGEPLNATVMFNEPSSEVVPTSYQINWGDGTTSTYGTDPDYGGAFTHTFQTYGTVTVNVTLDSNAGTYYCSEVVGITPYLNFTFDDVGFAESGVPYTFYVRDGGCDPLPTYTLGWGDDTTYIGTAATLTHVYTFDEHWPDPDTTYVWNYRPVSFSVTEGTSTETFGGGYVTVYPSSSGEISPDTVPTATEGSLTTFSADFTAEFNPPTLPDNAGWSVAWGDGLTGTVFSPDNVLQGTASHAYALAGTYTIQWGVSYEDINSTGAIDWRFQAFADQQVVVTHATPTFAVSGATYAVDGEEYTLASTPTVIHPGTAEAPQLWIIAWGDGSTDAYQPFHSFPEHTYNSPGEETIVATAITNEGTYATSWSVNVYDPEMHVVESDGTTLDHQTQETDGAILGVDYSDMTGVEDTLGNDIPDYSQTAMPVADTDLLEVTFDQLPTSVGGTYTISWSSPDFTVWSDAEKDTQLTSGYSFAAAPVGTSIAPVFLEGMSISSQMAANGMTLTWTSNDYSIVRPVDILKPTVLSIVGPTIVPGYGIYSYYIRGPAVPAGPSAWSAAGGTVLTGESGFVGANIQWGGGPAFASVLYTPLPGFTISLPVTVFQIAVTAPGGTPFPTGTPYDGGAVFMKNAGKTILGKNIVSGTPAGLTWNAMITVNGPLNSNGVPIMAGVNQLRIGYIQNLTGYIARGVYGTTWMKSNLEHVLNAYPYLDAASDAYPWYRQIGAGTWTPALDPVSHQFKTTLTELDQPTAEIPFDLSRTRNAAVINSSSNRLTSTQILDQFVISVCAVTEQDASNYVREATASWSFDGDGTVAATPPLPARPLTGNPAYTWTPTTAIITPPTAWTPVTDGSSPVVRGATANQILAGGIGGFNVQNSPVPPPP
ncbi:MAG TPA: PKD domain-containing protein, partial [Tepidisphaeraceae bacterium]|nr:PKD domain-containing protein [Tepidisphaeraceae bacterium]